MKDYSVSAHEELRRLTADQDFNWFVIIGYDSHEGKLTQAYSLQGHPDDWTQKEVAHAAWQLTSAAADAIKLEVENPGTREFKVTTKRGVFLGTQRTSAYSILLAMVGIATSTADKRLWLSVYLSLVEIGLSVKFYEGEESDTGLPYWAFRVLIGPLTLQVSQRK